MTREEALMVKQRIKQEGFDYCFTHYSNFEEIQDPEFHKLRNYYLQHVKLLENYIQKTIEEYDD